MGDDQGARFGDSVVVTDFDGDEMSDVIVSAPENDQTEMLAGAVYLFQGNLESGTHTPDAVMYGEEAGGFFGSDLAVGANGIWVGAPGVDLFSGAVYLLTSE